MDLMLHAHSSPSSEGPEQHRNDGFYVFVDRSNRTRLVTAPTSTLSNAERRHVIRGPENDLKFPPRIDIF
jgi:hypothetical protein